jgi:hypothetical protein
MKGPLVDELDAGGTISSVAYQGVLKDSKKTLQVENVRGREEGEGKNKREEPKTLPP